MHPSVGPLLQLMRLLAAEPELAAAAEEAAAWMMQAPSEADTQDDFEVAPPGLVARCEERLGAAGVEFATSRLPVHKQKKSGLVCGAQQVVRYGRGPGKIRWKGKPKVTCPVALALARFEGIVQEEAERIFDRSVVRVEHMGTYNCREMAAYPGWVSEHSYGNAIDIKRFVLTGGRTISVLEDYGDPAEKPVGPKAEFLRTVAQRAYDENVFSVVLTPAFDRAHRNHFHLDMARYRVDGSRP